MFDKQKVKVGIAPLTWTNDDLPELGGDISFEQCIREMALAGYQGCEVGNKFPKDVKQLKQALAPYQLQIASAWFSSYFSNEQKQKQNLEDFKVHAEFLHNMGAKVIVVAECESSIQQTGSPILGEKPVLTESGWTHLIDGLHEAGRIAHQRNLQIVYHYHMGTVIQNTDEIAVLMSKTDPTLVSLLLDTGHLYFAGGNSVALIEQFGHRIKHVHLKDIRANILHLVKNSQLSFLDAVKAGVFTVPGDGCIDFEPIFAALSACAYTGWLLIEAEQDPEKANPLEFAKLGRETVRSLAGV